MQGSNQTVLTVVGIILVALIILWLICRLDKGSEGSMCYGPVPDPVGGVRTESLGNGQMKISWDPTPGASSYRVYLNDAPAEATVTPPNAGFNSRNSPNRPKAECGQSSCCPTADCESCVSQSNYKKLLKTEKTYVIVETCEPRLCFVIVPYNSCGQAGACHSVQYLDVDCAIHDMNCWIVKNDCRGLEIRWDPPKCCSDIEIYVNGVLQDTVSSSVGSYSSDGVDCCAEIAVRAPTTCGDGDLNVLVPACPTGVFERPESEIVTAPKPRTRSARLAKGAHRLNFKEKTRRTRK